VVLTSPRRSALARNRWRLADLAEGVGWLLGRSVSGVWGLLQRLGFSRRQAQPFVRSPDVQFDAKWRAILQAYAEAVAQPETVRLVFVDEVSCYRQPTIAPAYALRGGAAPRAQHVRGSNTVTRIVAGLEASSGQVSYLLRSGVEVGTFCAFLQHLRTAHPPPLQLRVVLDNWSVHVHPRTQARAGELGLTLLYLPTYASWLNPIEKLWRWLRQDVIHLHDSARDVAILRERIRAFLDQFATASPALLRYVGLPVD
jgi:transposase